MSSITVTFIVFSFLMAFIERKFGAPNKHKQQGLLGSANRTLLSLGSKNAPWGAEESLGRNKNDEWCINEPRSTSSSSLYLLYLIIDDKCTIGFQPFLNGFIVENHSPPRVENQLKTWHIVSHTLIELCFNQRLRKVFWKAVECWFLSVFTLSTLA